VCPAGSADCTASCNVELGGSCIPTTCGAQVSLPCNDHDPEDPQRPGGTGGGTGGGGPRNLTLHTQTWASSSGFGSSPDRATDDNTDGNFWNGSVFHSEFEAHPEWGAVLRLDNVAEIDVWNRDDCCSERLNGAAVWLRRGSIDHTWDHVATLSGKPGLQVFNVKSFSRVASDAVAIVGQEGYLQVAEVVVLSW
jgi:hypothetical protein